MAVTLGDIVTEIAGEIHDPDMDDWQEAELLKVAKRAVCETVVAALCQNQTVSQNLTAGTAVYSGEPVFEPTMVSLGGEALNEKTAGDPSLAEWSSLAAGTPENWRQSSGATILVSPTPDADGLGLIGTVSVSTEGGPGTGPGAGHIVGDVLEVKEGGELRGGLVTITAVDDDGKATAVALTMRDRSTRGSGYTVGNDKETYCAAEETRPGPFSPCYIHILTLAKLEITGYSGITEPAASGTTITAIPEHLVKPGVVPLGVALALERRRNGTANLALAQEKWQQWSAWAAKMAAAARGKR